MLLIKSEEEKTFGSEMCSPLQPEWLLICHHVCMQCFCQILFHVSLSKGRFWMPFLHLGDCYQGSDQASLGYSNMSKMLLEGEKNLLSSPSFPLTRSTHMFLHFNISFKHCNCNLVTIFHQDRVLNPCPLPYRLKSNATVMSSFLVSGDFLEFHDL